MDSIYQGDFEIRANTLLQSRRSVRNFLYICCCPYKRFFLHAAPGSNSTACPSDHTSYRDCTAIDTWVNSTNSSHGQAVSLSLVFGVPKTDIENVGIGWLED